jgi:hypothetical protein
MQIEVHGKTNEFSLNSVNNSPLSKLLLIKRIYLIGICIASYITTAHMMSSFEENL